MTQPVYSIQDLCDQSGLPRRTIHFYIQQELLPPPNGAGLGARYDAGHMLRLRLIPLLRRDGLRLDEIRKRLQGLTVPAMQALLEQQMGGNDPPRPAAMSASAPPNGVLPVAALPPHGERYTHYSLRPGWTLAVPAGLNAADQRRLGVLLEAAARILAPAPVSPKE